MKPSLIGLSGYAQSGKNTVADIIQYLNYRNIYKGVPSDFITLNEFQSIFCVKERKDLSGWEQKPFAAKLKQIASLLTGISVEKFEDPIFKQEIMPEQWSQEKGMEGMFPHPYIQRMTVREFLQQLGTDAIRNNIHPNAWVNALFADYRPTTCKDYTIYCSEDQEDICHKGYTYGCYPSWIITDTRFPNEYKAIKDRNGIVVRITRKDVNQVNNHSSETALDDYNFDYTVENSGTIEDLVQEVKTKLSHII